MLEQIDLTKKMEKEEYKAQMEGLEAELSRLQRTLREKKIPVIIVFEGFDAAGKGLQINQLIHPLDPRGFQVFATKESSEEEKDIRFYRNFLLRHQSTEELPFSIQAGTERYQQNGSNSRWQKKNFSIPAKKSIHLNAC